jgi:hypothetical protein
MLLGDTNWSPELVVLMHSFAVETKMETEGETCFFFLEALMKCLAACC